VPGEAAGWLQGVVARQGLRMSYPRDLKTMNNHSSGSLGTLGHKRWS
jgi:hypothetical protein